MARLDPDCYLPYAADLGIGQEIRVEHCKPGKRKLYIKRKSDGIVAHCFHCGSSGRTSTDPVEDMADPAGCSDAGSYASGPSFRLPADSEGRPQEWPHEAREWLTWYLTDEQITDSPFCYSAEKGGIVFPFNCGGELAGYQVRHFPAKSPKYLTYRDKSKQGIDPYLHEDCEDIVLVEDMVSAYKAYLAGFNTAPLMGTTLTKERFTAIVNDFDRVTVALDNDNNQVRKLQAKLVRDLSAYCAVKSVLLDRDLKEYDLEMIREILLP